MGRRSCVRVLALCLVAGSAGLSSADTYPRQPGIDVAHYVFRLTLSDETDAIEGQATVDIRVLSDGVAATVQVDWAGAQLRTHLLAGRGLARTLTTGDPVSLSASPEHVHLIPIETH